LSRNRRLRTAGAGDVVDVGASSIGAVLSILTLCLDPMLLESYLERTVPKSVEDWAHLAGASWSREATH
jgi:hypothetical protein